MENYITILFTAIFGGIFGGVGSAYLKYFFDEKSNTRKRDEESKILADSIRGEIRSVRDHMKIYRRATKGYLGNLPSSGDGKTADGTAGMRYDLDYFSKISTPIFQENAGRIGLLWNMLAKEVVEFYSDLNVLKIFSERTVKSENDAVFNRRVRLFCDECDALIKEATLLNKRISQFSLEGIYPEGRVSRYKFLAGPKD